MNNPQTQNIAEIMLKYAEIKLYDLQNLIGSELKLLKAQHELANSTDSNQNELLHKVNKIMEEVEAFDEQYLKSIQAYEQAENDLNLHVEQIVPDKLEQTN